MSIYSYQSTESHSATLTRHTQIATLQGIQGNLVFKILLVYESTRTRDNQSDPYETAHTTVQ